MFCSSWTLNPHLITASLSTMSFIIQFKTKAFALNFKKPSSLNAMHQNTADDDRCVRWRCREDQSRAEAKSSSVAPNWFYKSSSCNRYFKNLTIIPWNWAVVGHDWPPGALNDSLYGGRIHARGAAQLCPSFPSAAAPHAEYSTATTIFALSMGNWISLN